MTFPSRRTSHCRRSPQSFTTRLRVTRRPSSLISACGIVPSYFWSMSLSPADSPTTPRGRTLSTRAPTHQHIDYRQFDRMQMANGWGHPCADSHAGRRARGVAEPPADVGHQRSADPIRADFDEAFQRVVKEFEPVIQPFGAPGSFHQQGDRTDAQRIGHQHEQQHPDHNASQRQRFVRRVAHDAESYQSGNSKEEIRQEDYGQEYQTEKVETGNDCAMYLPSIFMLETKRNTNHH